MQIRILKSGEVKHVENSLGHILVSAGLCEEVKQPVPKADFSPRWSVEVINSDGTYPTLAIVLRIAANVSNYTGHPDEANAVKCWPGGKRFVNFGRECPARIVDEYRRVWMGNPELRGEVVENIRFAAQHD